MKWEKNLFVKQTLRYSLFSLEGFVKTSRIDVLLDVRLARSRRTSMLSLHAWRSSTARSIHAWRRDSPESVLVQDTKCCVGESTGVEDIRVGQERRTLHKESSWQSAEKKEQRSEKKPNIKMPAERALSSFCFTSASNKLNARHYSK